MILFYSGALLALLSAFLFGVSPVLIKSFSGNMPPVLMAGILYLGSGIGLLALRLFRHETIFKNFRALPYKQKLQLAEAIAFGGILARSALLTEFFIPPRFRFQPCLIWKPSQRL